MNDREMRAGLCSALPWLTEDLERDGRRAELDSAVRAVLAETPVLEATAGLDIPPHVLGEPGPVRGEEPGAMIPGMTPRSAGTSYRCPDGWCSLNVVRRPGGELPAGGRCWLRDRPLRVVEA
ncbi:hypothetical protein [Streptomyces sp. TRM64462]|uniref:hypothetical protein n=1 Tax=Streptomyces sp. TRM64462 TaxID=2741726 RepID=UPI001586DF84|nr:hypothetical protein [Streptomyces sp. TRM64462]